MKELHEKMMRAQKRLEELSEQKKEVEKEIQEMIDAIEKETEVLGMDKQ